MLKGKNILIVPSDWGLGHAARCIPLINFLQKKGAQVHLGTSGKGEQLLKQYFPDLPLYSWPTYDVTYSSHAALSVLGQIPQLLAAIRQEHRHLQGFVAQHAIDGIISDNRYGCWHTHVPSVFITHQINIKAPKGFRWFEPLLYRLNRRYIQRFDACWIPDFEQSDNLSGELSHHYAPPHPHTFYIGPLSRFANVNGQIQKNYRKNYDVLALLSGPEPQRSRIEQKIIKQVRTTSLDTLIVRGKPGEPQAQQTGNIQLRNHLPDNHLAHHLQTARYIVARAGYSTIMDLVALQRTAILIPTPGQTEQEYLARYLGKRNLFHTTSQSTFDLEKSLTHVSEQQRVNSFTFPPFIKALSPALAHFLEIL
jgi:uncharacterized protein (TIGR00661 family)